MAFKFCCAQEVGQNVRYIYAFVGVFVASSSAFPQPICDDHEVLQQVMIRYFGLAEFKGMTDAEMRQKIILAPEMQHWRAMAKKNEVGEAIAKWVIDIDVDAIIAARHLVRSVTALPIAYESNSKKYTCQAAFDFDNEKLIPYLTLVTLNSWLRLETSIQDLDLGIAMNNMEKWYAAGRSLDRRLRQIAERITSCVRKNVSFTIQPSAAGFTIDLEPAPALGQDCVMRSSALR
jgi:hypothetical protein